MPHSSEIERMKKRVGSSTWRVVRCVQVPNERRRKKCPKWFHRVFVYLIESCSYRQHITQAWRLWAIYSRARASLSLSYSSSVWYENISSHLIFSLSHTLNIHQMCIDVFGERYRPHHTLKIFQNNRIRMKRTTTAAITTETRHNTARISDIIRLSLFCDGKMDLIFDIICIQKQCHLFRN